MKLMKTWAGRSEFTYSGCVGSGVKVVYGKTQSKISISQEQFKALLIHFRGRTLKMGTVRINPPVGSVGQWLIENVSKTATASYVGAILIDERYAQRNGPKITFPE